MITLKFMWLLLTGVVVPAGEHEGHALYTLYFNETNQVIDHAYKGEILMYIKTGEFEYNEDYEYVQEKELDETIFYSKN